MAKLPKESYFVKKAFSFLNVHPDGIKTVQQLREKIEELSLLQEQALNWIEEIKEIISYEENQKELLEMLLKQYEYCKQEHPYKPDRVLVKEAKERLKLKSEVIFLRSDIAINISIVKTSIHENKIKVQTLEEENLPRLKEYIELLERILAQVEIEEVKYLNPKAQVFKL